MSLLGNRIFTRRLILRKLEEEDIPLFSSWSCSQEIYGKFLTPENLDLEEARQRFSEGLLWNDQSRTFLITLRDETPIGTIHYWLRPEKQDTAIMALKILPDFRNHGYGTEVQKFVIIHLFKQIGVAAVDVYTDIDNRAEQRCLTKLGFDLQNALQYEDQHIKRTGLLYHISKEQYRKFPLYQFHYE